MTTNGKHEPETAIDWTGYDAGGSRLRQPIKNVDTAAKALRGRHCTVPVEPADGQGITQRSA